MTDNNFSIIKHKMFSLVQLNEESFLLQFEELSCNWSVTTVEILSCSYKAVELKVQPNHIHGSYQQVQQVISGIITVCIK